MKHFKVNYNKLANLKQINYYNFVLILEFVLAFLLLITYKVSAYHTISTYGIYENNILNIKINTKLSDAVKNNDYIIFNNTKVICEFVNFGEYEIIDNEIYQNVTLKLDKQFIDKEVGLVKIKYDREKLIKFIFELFK